MNLKALILALPAAFITLSASESFGRTDLAVDGFGAHQNLTSDYNFDRRYSLRKTITIPEMHLKSLHEIRQTPLSKSLVGKKKVMLPRVKPDTKPSVSISPQFRFDSNNERKLSTLPSNLQGVFGTKKVKFSTIANKKNWARVRDAAFSPSTKVKCDDPSQCAIKTSAYSKLIEQTGGKTLDVQLQAVNSFVNSQITYKEDIDGYNNLDYWATASQTINNGYGDCEDFAILKYNLLLKMGVSADAMSLIVLKDNDRDLFHAVLAVKTSEGYFVLDNLNDKVYADYKVRNYQPLYSFSQDKSWLHGKQKIRHADLTSKKDVL